MYLSLHRCKKVPMPRRVDEELADSEYQDNDRDNPNGLRRLKMRTPAKRPVHKSQCTYRDCHKDHTEIVQEDVQARGHGYAHTERQ